MRMMKIEYTEIQNSDSDFNIVIRMIKMKYTEILNILSHTTVPQSQ